MRQQESTICMIRLASQQQQRQLQHDGDKTALVAARRARRRLRLALWGPL
jgi:hypothetical protein